MVWSGLAWCGHAVSSHTGPQSPTHCPPSGNSKCEKMEEAQEVQQSRVKEEGEIEEEEGEGGEEGKEREEGGGKERARWTVELGNGSQEIVCVDSDDRYVFCVAGTRSRAQHNTS